MLKKMKGKMKRRNTEPMMLVSPGAQPQFSVHTPDATSTGGGDTSPSNHHNDTVF